LSGNSASRHAFKGEHGDGTGAEYGSTVDAVPSSKWPIEGLDLDPDLDPDLDTDPVRDRPSLAALRTICAGIFAVFPGAWGAFAC
jgi:hypothetical protein